MKFLSLTVFALITLAQAKGGRVYGKRGTPGYTVQAGSPAYSTAPQSPVTQYSKTFQPGLEQRSVPEAQQYVSQSAAYSAPTAQQYYQAEPQVQAVAYAQSQPGSTKYAALPAAQKFAYSAQPQPQQYSSAADVSSFSYSSPIVAYNNLGYLHQIIGKTAGAQQPSVASYSAQTPKVQYTGAPTAKIQYTPNPSVYTAAQNSVDAPNVYQAVAQKAAYDAQNQVQALNYESASAQNYQSPASQNYQSPAIQSYQSPSSPSYQSPSSQSYQSPSSQRYQSAAAAAQKLAYTSAPAYQTQLVQKAAPQANYAVSPTQQYSFRASQPSPTQSYETAEQSAPQVFYSQPSPQSQYYSLSPQGKYAMTGSPYAQ